MMQRWIVKVLGISLIVASFTAGWILLDLQNFLHGPLAKEGAEVRYEVQPGAGLIAVARDLHRMGAMEHPYYLVWYARWRGGADSIKAGEYLIKPQMTPLQLLDTLARGDVMRYTLTIPEGWAFSQMLAAVQAHEKIRHTLDIGDGQAVMRQLGYPGQHPEGRFFPDTYLFPASTTDVALLQYAYTAMERRLKEEWRGRAPGLPLETPYQALILASIVEKETGSPDERARIAGVFIRRLQRGMRLQTDPTVIYGLGAGFDGNLRRRDLEADTPYNTYTRAGLPPTPIALPGAAALHAVLHPAPGDELFFVSRGDGTHHFSASLLEHNDAVRDYQLNNGRGGK
jgi:UPF0755 protein